MRKGVHLKSFVSINCFSFFSINITWFLTLQQNQKDPLVRLSGSWKMIRINLIKLIILYFKEKECIIIVTQINVCYTSSVAQYIK